MSELTDVPETMLWTLHNRASESMRQDGIIDDMEAERIYRSIDYDYQRSFGNAEASHALRSILFDEYIEDFMVRHPEGSVVNLGEGLETQRFRLGSNSLNWYSVDLPEAIAQREKFIQPDQQHHHLAYSALDIRWLTHIDKQQPAFITAQGLFMYFKPQQVKTLLLAIVQHFDQAYILFDTIPQWLSNKTTSKKGWRKTKHYTTPPMPWGVNCDQLVPLLTDWLGDDCQVTAIQWPAFPRGIGRWLMPVAQKIPKLRNTVPVLAFIQFQK